MTDKQWEECKRIREIARAECEREAVLADSLAHTPLLKVETLTDEQCVLLYAIYLTRLKQSGNFGAPRQSVDPTEYFYAHNDADRAKCLTNKRQNVLAMLSEWTEAGEPKSFWEGKLAEVSNELDQLNQAEPMSDQGIAVWEHLLAAETERSDETYQRAREVIAGSDKTESPTGKLGASRPPEGSAADKPQPPPAFDASKEWIFSSDLAKLINVKNLSDIRKKATVDEADEHGRWGMDAVGTFRRRVDGRQAAYFIPLLKPHYANRYNRSVKATG